MYEEPDYELQGRGDFFSLDILDGKEHFCKNVVYMKYKILFTVPIYEIQQHFSAVLCFFVHVITHLITGDIPIIGRLPEFNPILT